MTKQRGNTLIEILVVVAVLAILAGWLLPKYLGHSKSSSLTGSGTSPVQRARAVDCANNIHQIALALQMAAASDEHPPQDIRAALRNGVTEQMLRCPETGKPYHFDPQTQIISCQTPGHQDLAEKVPGG